MNSETVMHGVGDTISMSVLAGYFLSALPAVSLMLTIVWMGIRIYETDTVQKLLGKKHEPLS